MRRLQVLCSLLLIAIGEVEASGNSCAYPIYEPQQKEYNPEILKKGMGTQQLNVINSYTAIDGTITYGRCEDDTWTLTNQGDELLCFKTALFADVPTSFEEGKAICNVRFGGHVAPFRGENDRDAIRTTIQKLGYRLPRRIYTGLYIGLKDIGPKTVYKKADYRWDQNLSPLLNYTTWAVDQPSRGGDGSEQCTTVLVNDNLNWNDVRCRGERDFIGVVCAKEALIGQDSILKKALESAQPVVKRSTYCEDDTWTLQKPSEKDAKEQCFKVVNFTSLPSSFEDGKQLCKRIGANVASMKNQGERKAMQDNIRTLNLAGTAKNPVFGYFIGLRDSSPNRKVPADYRWENDGSKLKTDSAFWQKREPNRHSFGKDLFEQCVAVALADGLRWNDCPCSPNEHINKRYLPHGIICAMDAYEKFEQAL